MDARKLVKAGSASHTISLPKEWIERNKLQKGDTVYLSEKGSELTITINSEQQHNEQKEKTINIDDKKIETLQREITAAYLNNYSTITLIGDNLAERAKDIRKILHDFVALEIVEQTAKRIVAKDLLNPKEISINNSIRKIDMLIRTMFEDINNPKTLENVSFRDFDINKTYFLLLRILKNCAKNSNAASSFGIKSEHCLTLNYLTINLENIGDCIKNICTALLNAKKANTEKTKDSIALLNGLYLDSIKAFYNKDKALADSICSRYTEAIDSCNKIADGSSVSALVEVADQLKTLATLVNNIARITIDEE